MKILLATDSSGVLPSQAGNGQKCPVIGGWTSQLMKQYPSCQFTCLRSYKEVQLGFTIYSLAPYLDRFADGHFDLAIIKSGYHERVAYYQSRFLSQLFKPWYSDRCLRHHHKIGGKDLYSYRDIEGETCIFDVLRRKSKRSLFIGMHSLAKFSIGDSFKPSYEDHAAEMREDFSKMTTDYLPMPLHEGWADIHLGKDRMHLNQIGIDYMVKSVGRYLT